jgi:uncharacterized protein (TIGR04222 family)
MTRYLAAEGDTWGISGPTFLWIYALIAVLTAVGVVIWRRQYTSGPRGTTRRELTPTEAAYINGAAKLAVYSAFAALRAAGAVAVVNGHLEQSGPMPMDAPELDRAVYAAAGRRPTPSSVQTDSGVVAVLERVERGLAEEGYILRPEQQKQARKGWRAEFAVFVFGAVRACAGVANHKSIGFLILLMFGVGVTTLFLAVVPRQTSAGKALIASMRQGAAHLRPNQSPSWATYGPVGAALGVGLFGSAAFWAADPAFAAEAQIQRNIASSGYNGSDAGGGDAGSSCGGGGGCGGGCGGGGCGG